MCVYICVFHTSIYINQKCCLKQQQQRVCVFFAPKTTYFIKQTHTHNITIVSFQTQVFPSSNHEVKHLFLSSPPPPPAPP
mmetsp:Transcript_43729/g.66020  ORF Transcript_43729/g.66020 Transcript_43729/m.66020 type:complete len:80 (-) Transcript_43729:28-267(-)